MGGDVEVKVEQEGQGEGEKDRWFIDDERSRDIGYALGEMDGLKG